MALPTYSLTDFTGVLALSPNRFGESDFDSYVLRYKTEWLQKLLGAKAYSDMQLNTKTKWENLLSGGSYSYIDCDGDEAWGYISGLDTVMTSIIYYYIVRDDFTMTETGAIFNYNENSYKVRQYHIAKDRWNGAVDYWSEIILYFERLKIITTQIDSYLDLGGTYEITILTAIPTFTDIGETITINEVDYVITDKTSVIGVSETITITAVTGLIFTEYTQSPYKVVKSEKVKYILL